MSAGSDPAATGAGGQLGADGSGRRSARAAKHAGRTCVDTMAINLNDFSIRYPEFPKYIWDSATPYSDLMQVCSIYFADIFFFFTLFSVLVTHF